MDHTSGVAEYVQSIIDGMKDRDGKEPAWANNHAERRQVELLFERLNLEEEEDLLDEKIEKEMKKLKKEGKITSEKFVKLEAKKSKLLEKMKNLGM